MQLANLLQGNWREAQIVKGTGEGIIGETTYKTANWETFHETLKKPSNTYSTGLAGELSEHATNIPIQLIKGSLVEKLPSYGDLKMQ